MNRQLFFWAALAVGMLMLQRVDARLGALNLNETRGLRNLEEAYDFTMDTPKLKGELEELVKDGKVLMKLPKKFYKHMERFLSFDCGGGFASLRSLSDLGFDFSDSPLAFLGDVNLFEILENALSQVGINSLLLPQKVCATDSEGLSQLGEDKGIDACEYVTSLGDIDVWAFGGAFTEKSLCAAFSFETVTVSFAQKNIIPVITLPIPARRQLHPAAVALTEFLKSLKITLVPKVISLSFLRGLSTPTLTKLWDGNSDPAILNVPGNFRFGGAGDVGFGFGVAGYDIKATIQFDGAFVFDSDYSGDGLVNVLRGELFDMAFLIQGRIIPRFEVFQIYELNFAEVFKGVTADMYTVLSGEDTRQQIGCVVAISLAGICKIAPEFEFICEVFSADAEISGSINTYLSKDGLGMRLVGTGHLKFNPTPVYDWLLDLIKYPEDGIALGAEITAKIGVSSTICLKMHVSGGLDQKFCTPENYGRGVGTIPGRVADCPSGYTNNGLTCGRGTDDILAPSLVADCPSGYTNMGLTCYRSTDDISAPSLVADCPSGYTNMGLTCFRGTDDISVPSLVADCPSGYTNMGASCYKWWPPDSLSMDSMSCPGGYFKTGARCYEYCPSGYTNTGEYCHRGAVSLSGDSMVCPSGFFKSDITQRCCQTCPDGYTNTGETCHRPSSTLSSDYMVCPSGYFKSDITQRCCQNCPDGYTNTGETCHRPPSTLGIDAMVCLSDEIKVGPRCYPASGGDCFDGEEEDAGLCYKKCESGFKGIGPMCWKVDEENPSRH